jgi:hypothetical protein
LNKVGNKSAFSAGRWGTFFITAAFALTLCELYVRLPFIPQRLEYQIDQELIAKLKPNQRGFMWMGNMSYKSPVIMINRDGHRGEETDWSKPVILAVGNSEAFGSGVSDDQVWTAVLELSLNQVSMDKDIQVVNAAHPGHGPYHQYITARRVLVKHKVETLIVRVDFADRYFRYIEPGKREKMLRNAQFRSILREYSKGIPFIFNKISAQLPAIRSAVKIRPPWMIKGQAAKVEESGRKMWNENKAWWSAISKLADEYKIPTIFWVYDLRGLKESAFLEQALREIAKQNNHTAVIRLGPEYFGIEPEASDEERASKIRELTFERDPHANPRQHELIGLALSHYLKEMQWLPVESKNESPFWCGRR